MSDGSPSAAKERADVRRWIVLGRDEHSDEIDGPWWPLYGAGPLVRAKSAEAAIRQVRKRGPIEDVWTEFVAIPYDVWEPIR